MKNLMNPCLRTSSSAASSYRFLCYKTARIARGLLPSLVVLVALFALGGVPSVRACDPYFYEDYYMDSTCDEGSGCWIDHYERDWYDILGVYVDTEDFYVDDCSEDCTGGTQCEEGESCEICEGGNPFQVATGNVMRAVTDLEVAGAAQGKLTLRRHHNSVQRSSDTYAFGHFSTWRHSWLYGLLEEQAPEGRRCMFIYPSGARRVFYPTAEGAWVGWNGLTERLTATAEGYEVTLANGVRCRFVRMPARIGGANRFETRWAQASVRYEMRELTSPSGAVTRLTYDADGYLLTVTEPAGRSLTFAYRELSCQYGQLATLGTIAQAPAAGQWVELMVPANLGARVFKGARLQARTGQPLPVAELQFFAPGATSPLQGTPISPDQATPSTKAAAAAAFDGNATTVFPGTGYQMNFCGLDFGTAASALARVRILAAPGQESALVGAVVMANDLDPVPTSQTVLAKVTGSDGRAVQYDYSVQAAPDTGFEYAVLTGARYGDGTQAVYRYAYLTPYSRLRLVEADDPRYAGRAKHIQYDYYPQGSGMIHKEINPATGGVYASLELDPSDPDKRVVKYSDLRTVSYRTPQATRGRPTERTDSLGRIARFEYADQGKGSLMAKTDKAGRTLTYTYDAAGNKRTTMRGAKTEAREERDAQGRKTKTIDRHGRTTTYERNAQGQIVRHTSFDGAVRAYTYNAMGQVLTFQQRDGGVHRFGYNELGLKTTWTDPKGRVVRYGYDAQGRRVSITDPLGRTSRRELNERGLVTKLIRADGTTQQFAYDKYGRKIAETDAMGRTTKLTYDELSRVVRSEDPTGGVTIFDYTEIPQGCGSCTLVPHPSRIQYPDGRVEQRLYDTEGRMLARTVAIGTAAAATTTYAYDADNHLVSETDPLGRVTRYTYDEDGHRLTQVNPAGRITRWTYDDHGNMTSVTASDGSVTGYEYDANDRQTAVTDATGNVTRYAYDDLGNVTQITDALGRKTRFNYDGKRRTAALYADGSRETWEYDVLGREIKKVSPDGLTTVTTYDAGNRVLTVTRTAPLSTAPSVSSNTYDSMGRRLSTTDPLGRVTRWTYDERGNMLTTTLPDGSQTTFAYDSRNRRIASTDALGQTTRYTYTEAGDMASLTDAKGNTYAFTYDGQHRKTAMIYPGGSQETWAYDVGGRLIAYVNRSGQTKTIAYNISSQPISETWSAASALPSTAHGALPALPVVTTYTYNAAGRLAAVANGSAKLTYTYDALGHVVSETTDLAALVPGLTPQTVAYAYNAVGQRAGLIYPDDTKVSYAYDVRGRLTAIGEGAGKPLASYDYNKFGLIAQLTRDNGVTTTYAYDMAGQLTDIEHAQGRQVLAGSRYALDALGRRTAQTREDGVTEKYGYDATGQLTGVDYGAVGAGLSRDGFPQNESFAYDPMGNRTQVGRVVPNAPAATESYATNSLNQYTQVNGVVFAYDANGNLVSDGQKTYAYDSQNRLISVTSAMASVSSVSQIRAEFFYDARNRCVLRKYYVKGSQGQWVLDNATSLALTYDTAWNLLAERTLDGKQTDRYIHGQRTDEILSWAQGVKRKADVLYPLADGLGSTVALADDKGVVTQRYRYTAYGTPSVLTAAYQPNASSLSPSASYRYLFTGREWLAGVQLNDHRNRYYSPGLGRWLSTDPIWFKGGKNLYAYVGNRTVNNPDQFGLCCEKEQAAFNAATTAVALARQQQYTDSMTRSADSHSFDLAVDAYNSSPTPPGFWTYVRRYFSSDTNDLKDFIQATKDYQAQVGEEAAWAAFEDAASKLYWDDQRLATDATKIQDAELDLTIANIALTVCQTRNG
ncbi:MAG: hypothetical protein HZA31_10465 [Opitutae bacterium]|nr:hypothetical protein [Opitutae bacterium]